VGILLVDVEPETIDWVWPQRIARGKLTLLDGDPGLGKSVLTIDWAARITRGRPWPDGAACPSAGVVILSAEDGLADTIRPRLDACGADVARVVAVQAVGGDDHPPVIPGDLAVSLRDLGDNHAAWS
jgi:RecA-family ATPase